MLNKIQSPPDGVELFQAQRENLYGYLCGMIRHPQDAEDLLQEVWVRYSRALENGKEFENPSSWCRGVARNLALHYWRKQRRDPVMMDEELLDLVDLAFAEQDTQTGLWARRTRALDECLAELPEHSRKLVRLKYLGGQTAETVAEQLGRTAQAVLMALSRVRRVLRECVERKLEPGQDTE